MSDDLWQTRLKINLQVKVSVDVQQAWHQPLALCLYDIQRLTSRQAAATGGDTPPFNSNVHFTGLGTRAVKHQCISN